MAKSKVFMRQFSLSQVALHSSKDDCWIVIGGKVVDVTKFQQEHPGGEEALTAVGGKDATKDFEAIGHSRAAYALLLKHQVGVLEGYQGKDDDAVDVKDEVAEGRAAYRMTGSVLKDDGKPKYLGVVEFVVPFLLACLVSWYRISSAGFTAESSN